MGFSESNGSLNRGGGTRLRDATARQVRAWIHGVMKRQASAAIQDSSSTPLRQTTAGQGSTQSWHEATLKGFASGQANIRPTSETLDIPDLEFLHRIGHGSYGEVWLARNIVGTYRAVKIVSRKAFPDEEAFESEFFGLQRFEPVSREHDGFVAILHVGRNRAGGCFYYVMELADDDSNSNQVDPDSYVPKTLSSELARCGRLSVEHSAQLAFSLSEALAELHRRGLVHRDIKPSNIIFVKGHTKLADIGLVAKAGEKTRLGTEGYIPPEGPGAPQADLYSLGKVLYEASTGMDRLDYPALPPDFDTLAEREAFLKLNSIILKACDNDIHNRYQTATEISKDLTKLGVGRAVQAVRSNFLRNPVTVLCAVWLGALALTFPLYWLRNPPTNSAHEKSLAVLPFENLGSDREDASFADGVHDDILTKLAKIADLKVISRTSVMQYRDQHNMRQVGDALRASHVLQGSVRKTGAWLHINAQLIDTRTDTHIWAEQYDRDLKDVFTIQSEIAREVAGRLHARISPAEKLAIQRPPTSDLIAFDFYTRAKNLSQSAYFSDTAKGNLLQAADLLNQAVARDPSFFQAYCQLAWAHESLYLLVDHTPARLALAEAAIQAAFRLRPDAGEVHVARAGNLYRCYLDYNGALAELEIARQSLSNDSYVFALKGGIERRQGKHEDALRSFERAVGLDPRNVSLLQQIAATYPYLRRYAEAKSAYDRALDVEPGNIEASIARARVELVWKADTRPLHQLIDSIRTTHSAVPPSIADTWLLCALAERDVTAAKDALLQDAVVNNEAVHFDQPFVEGILARMANEDDKAQLAFTAARAEQEKILQTQPNYGPPLVVLGLIDAGLGRKEEALQEGLRAVALLPVEKDAINGPLMIEYFAVTAAWVGEKDLACQQLEILLRYPSSINYGDLKLSPFWDPLRGDPRFEKIVASLAPK